MKPWLVVLGTRPEAIKLAPVILNLRAKGERVLICSTGQHRTLLSDALEAFSLRPDVDLGLMKEGESTSALFGRMLQALDPILAGERPEYTLVQGDTLSALAGAMCSFYRGIPVAHLEAGLRTYHPTSPFPEEMHRTAIALLASTHFAPTDAARENLIREGRPERHVYVTGNTVVDAMRLTLARPVPPMIRALPSEGRLLVFTAHRREHLGRTMEGMFRALRRVIEAHGDTYAICPLHPNPRVREAEAVWQGCDRIRVVEPLGVVAFHHLLSRAHLVLTDSGGVQEEATTLGIPTVVMRYSTERSEGLRAGVLRLSGSGEEGIFSLADRLLEEGSELYAAMKRPSATFGDGCAAARVASRLIRMRDGRA